MKFAIIAVLWAAFIFLVQSLFFKKTTNKILQLIPLFILGIVYIVALVLFVSDLNRDGGVLMNTIFSFVISGVNTIALAADGVAWLIEKV